MATINDDSAFRPDAFAGNTDKIRMGHLKQIKVAIASQRGDPLWGGPSAPKACLLGLLAVIVTVHITNMVWVQGHELSALLAAFIAFLTVYIAVILRAPHKTYSALIYDLLAQYEPRNVAAYKQLQEEVKDQGLFGNDALDHWLLMEEGAVLGPLPISEAKKRFLEKRVNEAVTDRGHPSVTTDLAMYQVIRGELVSDKLATSIEVGDFLNDCGLASGTPEWQAALAGGPILVDGATMRFIRT